MVVVEVSEGSILGRVGPAQVLIPQMKLPVQSIRFRPQENAYELTSHDSEDSKTIKAGSIVFCRCFEMRVEMSTSFPTQTASCESSARSTKTYCLSCSPATTQSELICIDYD
jgi:hypothetical protein